MRGLASLLTRTEQRTINETDVPWTSATKVGQITITEKTALTLSAVWACQTLIADSIATLPVDTFRKQDNVRIPTTPPRWVEYPNPETRRVDFETQRLLSLLGWGNAYALLVRRNGSSDPMDPVIERWMIDPASVQVGRDAQHRIAYTVEGQHVPAGNMHHVRGYTLPGACEGMSVIAHARLSMGLGASAEAFGENFYKNGVTPSGILEVPSLPAEASKDVVERLRDSFAERYAGTGNSYKPVVLTGGTTWKQITINPVDAQFLETRAFQIEEIARWHRVPLHEIQRITDNASQGGGNGIESMSMNLAQRTLLPWTVRLEQADSELLPRGQYEKYNLNAFVRADIKTRHEVYALRRNAGMSNADELRALEDEAPIEGGDGAAYWRPANMVEVGEEADPIPPAEPVTTGDDTSED